MHAFKIVSELLKQLDTDQRSMPATILYNEGWMLRLVLDAGKKGLLSEIMNEGENWCSELQLRTPFGRDKGRNHESNTHADGVIGDFVWENDSKSGLAIRPDANRLIVFEAKMYSPLRAGTKNAPGYNQAARNVACIAETLRRAGRKAMEMTTVGFYVIAPQLQIDNGLFDRLMTPCSIRSRVEERIQQYKGTVRDQLLQWQKECFLPLLSKMESEDTLKCISWEQLISAISDRHRESGEAIQNFYSKCIQHNRSVSCSSEKSNRPSKGLEYKLLSGKHIGKRVRVVSEGRSNSRVYLKGGEDDTFCVPNVSLEILPETEQTPAPPNPIAGREYDWSSGKDLKVRVRVKRAGDVNSRVIRVDGSEASFKVPNHQLRLIESQNKVSGS